MCGLTQKKGTCSLPKVIPTSCILEGEQACVCARVKVRRRERGGERDRAAINLNTAVMGNTTIHFSSINTKTESSYPKNPQY